MATGSEGLLTLRGALGASEGASTTPTRILYIGGPENFDDTGVNQFETIEDRVAWAKRDGLRAVYSGMENNIVRFTNVPASFEDLGFWLATLPGIASGSTGLGGNTPTTVDTSAFSRTFTPSQTVTTVGSTGGYDLALQFAYNDLLSTVGWSIPGLRCIDFSITYRKRASGTDHAVVWSGAWQTPKAATQITSLTGSLSDRTQTIAKLDGNKSYVDSTFGSIGGTLDSNIMEATLHIQQDPSFHDGMDGTGLHTSMHFPKQWMSELTVTRKFSDVTELNAYTAKTRRAVSLLNEGGIVGGTTAKNTIRSYFVGYPESHAPTKVDGILYATVRYVGAYDSSLTSSWSFFTQNSIAAGYTTA